MLPENNVFAVEQVLANRELSSFELLTCIIARNGFFFDKGFGLLSDADLSLFKSMGCVVGLKSFKVLSYLAIF